MALRITASDFATSSWLQVDKDGVTFSEATLTTSRRKFPFSQIVSVLMAPDHVLSFQVGDEVFSIRTNPRNKKHQEVIAALLAGLRPPTQVSAPAPPAAPPLPPPPTRW